MYTINTWQFITSRVTFFAPNFIAFCLASSKSSSCPTSAWKSKIGRTLWILERVIMTLNPKRAFLSDWFVSGENFPELTAVSVRYRWVINAKWTSSWNIDFCIFTFQGKARPWIRRSKSNSRSFWKLSPWSRKLITLFQLTMNAITSYPCSWSQSKIQDVSRPPL